MYYEVYIDSLFFLNFMLDIICLLLVKRILKCTATHLSVAAAAMSGAGMVCVIMVMPHTGLWIKLLLMYGAVPILMLRMAFRLSAMKAMLRALFLLYACTFFIGGSMQWIGMHMPLFRENGLRMAETAGLACIVYFAGCAGYRLWKRRNKELVTVRFSMDGEEVSLRALIDTGNGLIEPISGKPVSVIDRSLVKDMETIKKEARYCIIPYHSIGREHGLLEGFYIPYMHIQSEERSITIENAVLGISEGSVSKTGSYQMILNPELLKE